MRALRRFLVLLVVVGALLVVVDRVGVWVAQRVVADEVADELAIYQVESAPPEVTIGGVPFLTQVGAGRYEEVTLLLREVGSAGVRLSQVELVATGVTAATSTLATGNGPIDAERVDGTAMVGYGVLAGLAGLDGLELSAAGGGSTVAIRLPTELLGEPAVLVGTADLAVTGEGGGDGGTVQLRVDELTVEEGANLPPGAEPAVEDIAQQLAVDLPLPPLPYGLAVQSVDAGSAGVVVHVSATDVPLAR